jgi:type II secretory pathway pseudopilin PulG
MKILQKVPGRQQQAFTLVELIVASGVAGLVLGVTMILLISSAKENRRGIDDATVQQAANDLESRIILYLRQMSANEGVVFSSPATNSGGGLVGYKTIIIARGPSPENPRQEINFNATQGLATYKSNRSSTNAPMILIQTNAHQALRLLAFAPSIKADGRPDNSLVNVLIKIDDNGSSEKNTAHQVSVFRTFAVKMRNN